MCYKEVATKCRNGGLFMSIKIVADSSADLLRLDGVDFAAVPLTISAGEREFVDDASLDIEEMLDFLRAYKGKSHTSCPGTGAYLEAFGDAEEVFCVTITRNLSGSYNAASVAAREYEAQHPGRRVHVVDTLTAGAECTLIAEKLRDLILEGKDFDTVKGEIDEYVKHTELIFALESIHNLAANGRVNPLVARISGALGIRVVGRASDDGVLDVVAKPRGMQKAVIEIVNLMQARGYKGGRLRIHNAISPEFEAALISKVRDTFGDVDIKLQRVGGLCAFYAERGGLMIGYETEA